MFEEKEREAEDGKFSDCKSDFLDPLSPDLVKAYTGEETGVGLYDIGNALA